MLIRAGFFENRNWVPVRFRKLRQRSVRLRLECIHEGLRLFGHFEQFRPLAVIVLAWKLARRVKPHVRTDVLLGGRVVE